MTLTALLLSKPLFQAQRPSIKTWPSLRETLSHLQNFQPFSRMMRRAPHVPVQIELSPCVQHVIRDAIHPERLPVSSMMNSGTLTQAEDYQTAKTHKPSPYPSINVAMDLNIPDLIASSLLINASTD